MAIPIYPALLERERIYRQTRPYEADHPPPERHKTDFPLIVTHANNGDRHDRPPGDLPAAVPDLPAPPRGERGQEGSGPARTTPGRLHRPRTPPDAGRGEAGARGSRGAERARKGHGRNRPYPGPGPAEKPGWGGTGNETGRERKKTRRPGGATKTRKRRKARKDDRVHVSAVERALTGVRRRGLPSPQVNGRGVRASLARANAPASRPVWIATTKDAEKNAAERRKRRRRCGNGDGPRETPHGSRRGTDVRDRRRRAAPRRGRSTPRRTRAGRSDRRRRWPSKSGGAGRGRG